MDYCELCNGTEFVFADEDVGIDCPDCLTREQDKLNAEHAEAIAKLIAENTKLRKFDGQVIHDECSKNTNLQLKVEGLKAENTKLREETQELNDLFDLQQTRMLTATKKWQEATENPGIFPDLGRLLDWLLAEMETNDA